MPSEEFHGSANAAGTVPTGSLCNSFKVARVAACSGAVPCRDASPARDSSEEAVSCSICSECIALVADGFCACCGRACGSQSPSTSSTCASRCSAPSESSVASVPVANAQKRQRETDQAASCASSAAAGGGGSSGLSRASGSPLSSPEQNMRSAATSVGAASGSALPTGGASPQGGTPQSPLDASRSLVRDLGTFPSWWLQKRERFLEQQRRLVAALPSISPVTFTEDQKDILEALKGLGYRVVGEHAREALEDFVSRYDSFVFDVDGVLLMGTQRLAGVADALQALRQRGKRLMFVTNSASKSRQICVDLLTKVGIEAYPEEVICSSYAAAQYVRTTHPDVKKVMIIGEKGLELEFREAGIEIVRAETHAQQPPGAAADSSPLSIRSEADFAALAETLDPAVGAVAIGWDRDLTFAKLCLASLYLQRDDGALPFIAANRDAFDVIRGAKMPANGAGVVALELCSSRQAFCVGKPSVWLAQFLLSKYRLEPRRTLVCGDRLDTDIAFGKNAGADTCVVFTGCTTVEDLAAMPPTHAAAPTFVIPHIGVLQALKNENEATGEEAATRQNGDSA
ncbi:HAD hydrolase, family IIA protein [Besnoitia besnoiti]|uniref:HAD hydrolase, family IIA protein n=1 Tax=Besnoitia besnoiti TaxID=94643 RepID=A0A2A9M9K5_BESBE|nr:HAD hydrolase, family IIA protein [Besnoitia besnoiti]PFH32070.1 HAD hydrolase, family IIA protein [Besnoitia besnoiti]